MNDFTTIVSIITGISIGIASGVLIARRNKSISLEDFQERGEKKINASSNESLKIIQDAKENSKNIKLRSIENEQYKKEQFERINKLLASKEEQIIRKEGQNKEMEEKIKEQITAIEKIKQINEKRKEDVVINLCKKAGTTTELAKKEMLEEFEREIKLYNTDRLQKTEQYMEDEKIRIAKNMIIEAIQRFSNPTASEKGPHAIIVERDEHKARIIGKDARVLIAIQELTECEIIFNDAPQTILIWSSESVKKHIGKEVVLKLLKDKNITEDKVRKTVEEEKNNLEMLLINTGKNILGKMEVKKEYSEDFYKLIGKLQFRSSYGQNILKHSYEVGYLTIMLGAELGLDIQTCKAGGFLHDLGKSIDQDTGEPHDLLTKKLMEEYEFSSNEIHAAWTHHDAETPVTAEALMVKAADAISAGRPGARQETLEKYLEHVRMIEGVANSYEGVEKSYAISAGRELRVLVQPKVLDDDMLPELVERISEEIEEEKKYPGKIKIKAIRRTNSIELAKKK